MSAAKNAPADKTEASGSRLSLCMIARDNEATIGAALASIRPWVDQMIVIDTGSRDSTPEIARSYGASVYEFPWCDDFSAARNVSLEYATSDWVFWMDTDDTIDAENGQKLRALATGPHDPRTFGYVMQVRCPGPDPRAESDVTVVDHVKLFRRHPDLRFEFRIHEQILPAIRRLGGLVDWTDLFVTHSGADYSPQTRRRKYVRDLRILRRELRDRPEHPFVLFNLGMTYADMDRHRKAAIYLRRCIAASQVSESHLRKAYALLVHSLTQLGQSADAWRICEEGLALYEDDPELLFRKGVLAQRAGRLKEAEAAYRRVLITDSERYFCSLDPSIKGYKARHNLALLYQAAGRVDLAELQWREALASHGPRQLVWPALVYALIDQGKFVAAEVELEQISHAKELQLCWRMASARLAETRSQLELARKHLDAALAEWPGCPEVQEAARHFDAVQGAGNEAGLNWQP